MSVWIDAAASGQGSVSGCFKSVDTFSGSVKVVEFF